VRRRAIRENARHGDGCDRRSSCFANYGHAWSRRSRQFDVTLGTVHCCRMGVDASTSRSTAAIASPHRAPSIGACTMYCSATDRNVVGDSRHVNPNVPSSLDAGTASPAIVTRARSGDLTCDDPPRSRLTRGRP
jgi:hypothetical protein